MAAPNLDFNLTLIEQLSSGTNDFVAPTLESANTPNRIVDNKQDGCGWDQTSNITGLYGGRCVLLSGGSDFSGKQYIWFQLAYESYNMPTSFDTLANGGLRILFEDSAGNWVRYNIGGRDTFFGPIGAGSWISFRNVGSSTDPNDGSLFVIDMDRTPDNSSGTIDWTDIVAFETHINSSSSNDPDLFIGRLNVAGRPIVTAGELADPCNLKELYSQRTSIPDDGDSGRWFASNRVDQVGANGEIYLVLYGWEIGDGSTATYWEQPTGQAAFYPSKEAQLDDPNGIEGYMSAFSGDDGVNGYSRKIIINQSASDYVNFQSGFTFSGVNRASGGEYDILVQGNTSGTCNFNTNQFLNANDITLAHASATDCVFDKCYSVTIDSNTTLTDAIIRNGKTGCKGLVIDDVAGDYSSIIVRFNNNSTHDIELGAGGAGTYNLSGITVASGYTLKIHNNSATNAITVEIPTGISFTTSTDGGSISVISPATEYTLEFPNIIDGSRYQIYNITTATELTNAVVSGGSGISEVYTLGTDYSANDEGRIRITYSSGATAKQEYETTFIFPASTTTNAIPFTQIDHEVYNALGIDGSTITNFTADYVNNEVDVGVASSFTGADFYAWWVYNLTTANGIVNFFGGVTAQNQANFLINNSVVDIFFDNTTSTNIRQTDNRRIYRKDGAYPVKQPGTGTGGIDIKWLGEVFIAETGVSGLTPTESAALDNILVYSRDASSNTQT